MFEKSKNVSFTNSNFYYTKGDMQMNFQQNSYTGGAPPDFYRGFGPTLRIPSDEIEEVVGSASLDDDRAEESRQPTPNATSAPILNSFSKCQQSIPCAEVVESATLYDDRTEESRQPTSNPTSAPILNSFSKSDTGIRITSAQEPFDKYLEKNAGPSRARYPPNVLRPSASSHTVSFPFDQTAFKMDMMDMEAGMKKMKKEMEKMKRDMDQPFFRGQVDHDPPEFFPGTMSSNDDTTQALSGKNLKYINETPSRRPEEDSQKQSERPISRFTGK